MQKHYDLISFETETVKNFKRLVKKEKKARKRLTNSEFENELLANWEIRNGK